MRASKIIGALFASIAGLYGGNALAGSMTATPIAIDKATAPDVITLPDITVQFGNNLAYQDDLVISVSGVQVRPPTYPVLPPVACDGPAGNTLTFGFVVASGNTWQFRVTSPMGSSTFGTQCVIRQLQITRSSLGETCQLSTSYQVTRFMVPGVVLDSGGPVTVATVTPCGPPPPRVVEVLIDIKPGTRSNDINTLSKGSVPVAILSSNAFYAPGDVDLGFPLMFGGAAMQPDLIKCNTAGEDVNYDGLVDLVCHFSTALTGFGPGDTVGYLIGKAKDGAFIVGSDLVRIVR